MPSEGYHRRPEASSRTECIHEDEHHLKERRNKNYTASFIVYDCSFESVYKNHPRDAVDRSATFLKRFCICKIIAPRNLQTYYVKNEGELVVVQR